jgi:HEAT repeat protein
MGTIEQLSKDLDSSDQVKVYQAKQKLALLTGQAGDPDKENDRAKMATALAEALMAEKDVKDSKGAASKGPQLGAQGRNLVCRYLASVAACDEVPALRKAMNDFDVREMARWALARMTCQESTDAMIDAASSSVGDEFRVGVINALATRRGSSVGEALRKCADDASPAVRIAAVEALACHPDAANDAIIAKGSQGPGRPAKRAAKARLRLAENLAKSGDKQAARKIYDAIASGKYDSAQQKAAKAALERLA